MARKSRVNPLVVGRADPDSCRKRPSIERKFAEQKKCHGLRQARYRGLAKVTIQVLIVCMVVNCKRMAKLQAMGTDPPRGGLCRKQTAGAEVSKKPEIQRVLLPSGANTALRA